MEFKSIFGLTFVNFLHLRHWPDVFAGSALCFVALELSFLLCLCLFPLRAVDVLSQWPLGRIWGIPLERTPAHYRSHTHTHRGIAQGSWWCSLWYDYYFALIVATQSQSCSVGNLWGECIFKSTSCILILLWFWLSNMLRAKLLIARTHNHHKHRCSCTAALRKHQTEWGLFRKSHLIKTAVRLPVSHSQRTAEILILDVSANPLIKLRKW